MLDLCLYFGSRLPPPDIFIHIILGIKYTINMLMATAFIRINKPSAGIPIEMPNVFSVNRIYGYR